DAYFVPEAAEIVISKELAKQVADSSHIPALPVGSYDRFEPLVVAQQKASESEIPEDAELAFLDRCIYDNLGYLAYNGLHHLIPDVERHAKMASYSIVFFCDW